MTNSVRVQLANTNRSVAINPNATEGAVLGVNLRYPDGSLVRLSDFSVSSSSTSGISLGTASSLFVPQTRTVSTSAPLAGGGPLSADLTITTSMATDKLLGRDAAGTGVAEEIAVGGGIEFTGSGGIQTSAFTGDVTKAAGGTATTIANNSVTYAKIQDVANSKILGRFTVGSGDVEEISIGSGLSIAGGTLAATTGAGSPLTTKGDIYAYSTTHGRFPVGVEGERPAANPDSTFGLRYERSAYDARYEMFWANEMMGKPPTSTTAGAGASYDLELSALTAGMTQASVASSSGALGVWQIDTGAVASGSAVVGLGRVDNIFTGAGRMVFWWRVLIPTLSDNTNNFTVFCGLNQSGNANRLGFSYNHATNSGNWTAAVIAASVGTPTASTGVAVTAGDWFYLELDINEAGTEGIWKVNGVTTNTISSGLPATSAGMRLQYFIVKSAGGTARQLNIDKMGMYQRFTNAQG